MTSRQTVSRDAARIFFIHNQHIAVVIGRKPRHCQEVELVEASQTEGVPTFSILAQPEGEEPAVAGAITEEVENYYLVKRLLPGPALSHINLHHRDGRDRVQVEMLGEGGTEAPAKFPARGTRVAKPAGQPQAGAVGFSQNFSFDEAFSEALRSLPDVARMGKAPTLVDVVAMGAIYGGFSGFSRMFVKVERRVLDVLEGHSDMGEAEGKPVSRAALSKSLR